MLRVTFYACRNFTNEIKRDIASILFYNSYKLIISINFVSEPVWNVSKLFKTVQVQSYINQYNLFMWNNILSTRWLLCIAGTIIAKKMVIIKTIDSMNVFKHIFDYKPILLLNLFLNNTPFKSVSTQFFPYSN